MNKKNKNTVGEDKLDLTSDKSRMASALLCGFFGLLGVHRFYVGKIWTGILMLALTVSLVFVWVSAVWAVIDFIMIVTGKASDSSGLTISEWNI